MTNRNFTMIMIMIMLIMMMMMMMMKRSDGKIFAKARLESEDQCQDFQR